MGRKEIKIEKLYKDNMKVSREKDILWRMPGNTACSTRSKLEGCRLKGDKN